MEREKKQIAVIIVLFEPNKAEIAKASRLACRYHGVIVDNSLSPAFISQPSHLMHYIAFQRNMGIAEAQNVAMRYIIENTTATHIVFLDQDSDIDENYPDAISEAFDHVNMEVPQLAFLGPRIENKVSGREYKSVIHRQQQITHNFILRRDITSSGGCTTTAIIREVGINDSQLFIDYVDFEWGWRAQSKGFVCGITPDITIQHMIGRQTFYFLGYTVIISAPQRYFYQYRNFLWLLPRCYVPLRWKVNTLIKFLARLVYFPLLVKSGRLCWRYMISGIAAGLKPSNQGQQKNIQ